MSGVAISKYYGVYQGLPAASGTLNVYQTGTTTPVTPYADAALMTPLSNPITLDANGTCIFYYSGAINLKLVAYTQSGTLIETLDPVYPTGGTVIGTTVKVSSNTTLSSINAGQNLICTTALNLTLPLSTTQSPSFNVDINAQGGAVTLIPQSSDAIQQQSAGTNFVMSSGTSGYLWTDAAGNYGLNFYSAPATQIYTLLQTQVISSAASSVVFSSSVTGYTDYWIKGRQLIASAQSGITLTFNAITSNYFGHGVVTLASSQTISSSGFGGASLSLDAGNGGCIAPTGSGGMLDLYIYAPSTPTSGVASINWKGNACATSSGQYEIYYGEGTNTTSSAVLSKVTLAFGISSMGVFSLYGIKQ